MALTPCPECGISVSDEAAACPHCGHSMKTQPMAFSSGRLYWGFEWRTRTEFFGWPLVHIAVGRSKVTGKLLVAKGIIAIGQFAIGLITFAQFGVGALFGFGQFMAGFLVIAQFALGIYFALGQVAVAAIAIGQLALGKYVLAQMGFGEHAWTTKIKDPVAIDFFKRWWYILLEYF